MANVCRGGTWSATAGMMVRHLGLISIHTMSGLWLVAADNIPKGTGPYPSRRGGTWRDDDYQSLNGGIYTSSPILGVSFTFLEAQPSCMHARAHTHTHTHTVDKNFKGESLHLLLLSSLLPPSPQAFFHVLSFSDSRGATKPSGNPDFKTYRAGRRVQSVNSAAANQGRGRAFLEPAAPSSSDSLLVLELPVCQGTCLTEAQPESILLPVTL